MRALDPSAQIDAFERGQRRSGLERSLILLAAALPEQSPTALWGLPTGSRDRLLLEARVRTLGPALLALARCAACGERLEVPLDLAALLREAPPPRAEVVVELDGWRLRLRAPSSLDLAATLAEPQVQGALTLLERCALERVAPEGQTQIPPEVVEAAAAAIGELDPLSEIQLSGPCPACGTRWSAILDIGALFWSELCRLAARAADDVHALASAYGWTEREILALSPARRQLYLDRVRSA